MRRALHWLLLWALSAALWVAFLFVFQSRAAAHDWYPVSCCSDKDCYETGSIEPDPKAVKGGWRLSDGTLVPYGKARVSPDGKFHVCRRLGNKALIEAGKPCLWVPGQVS